MPNQLHNLTIEEISLVDAPANSEFDLRTGRKVPRATVALYKRDSDSTSSKETVMAELTLKQILKSDNLTFSRESIATAVRAKARKVAAKRGISIEKAELRVWRKYPAAQLAYENAPTPVLKREPRMAQVTEAEAELDSRTRKRMKRTGESYPAACRAELERDPSLYERYEKELAAGSTFHTPGYTNFVNGNNGHNEDPAVDDNSMYARRPSSTSNGNDMISQERKGKRRS